MKDGIYYLLTSHTTSWERNDNYYYTAPSPEGPWENQGMFCPEGTLTYNSQCTFVTVPFKGKRISLVEKSDIESGYARIRIKDKEGRLLHDSLIDFYSKAEDNGTQFVIKTYPEDEYILEVEVAGENPVWFNKKGDRFGSTDFFVNVTETITE